MKEIIRKNSLAIVLAIVGAIAGLLYWKFVGCQSGACPIKSKWYLMTAYGILAGYLVGDIVSGSIKKKKETGNRENE
ncbi:MAG: DUF6132 family protein [Bacteroidales bacterium]